MEATLVNDLDGDGVIDPGDTIKYVITYKNIGDGQATNVDIVDDYDQTLIVNIANISADGRHDGDIINWNLGTVEAGAKGSVSYHATLRSVFHLGSTSVENKATIKSDKVEPVSAEASVLVEVIPTPTPTPPVTAAPAVAPTLASGQFRQAKAQGEGLLEATQITVLLALLLGGGLLAIGLMACRTLKNAPTGDWEKLIRNFIEGVALVVIFFTIVVLALHNAIEPDGIISIVSAIVGYILGRRAGA